MKKILISIGVAALLVACTGQQTNHDEVTTNKQSIPQLQDGDVIAGINLTVAESKRLIAKGIVNHPDVKAKLKSGIVIITSGTTNTYIAEELVNLDAPRGSFMTGHLIPEGSASVSAGLTRVPNITLIDGKSVDINYEEAMKQMKEDDIVFKGANMLSYERNQVAVCIGAPSGGTTSVIRNHTSNGNGRLIVPIGLEKEVYGDLSAYEQLLKKETKQLSYVPSVWMHHNAEIFTEIEAIKALAEVNVIPFAAGGISGREGGISLAVYGKKAEVQKILDLIATIQGEPPFVK